MRITRRRASVLALLSGAVAMAMVGTTFVADAQLPTTVKRAKLRIDCKITRGASASPCRGWFRLTGGFSDSGRLTASISDDRARTGATLRATLAGRKGRLEISDDGIDLSHKQRNCLYVSGLSVRNGTGEYEGYRGGTVRRGCLSLRITRRSIRRIQTATIRVEKRG